MSLSAPGRRLGAAERRISSGTTSTLVVGVVVHAGSTATSTHPQNLDLTM
ncbi:hypothetical protein D187_001303 [Cystobacter fuscus DSM 2262]|uniref:Uncharacterized protein n=1 Tax=Cystobacter fuscus (strain ATCC 25194 / DSM 2262 / NBRC 100088 / M29) TaxID=1242864 RepID=S9QHB0_CYSF2|nr:hypothetical protein D187_001303 [Cystobacter fuscus DSM 2262]